MTFRKILLLSVLLLVFAAGYSQKKAQKSDKKPATEKGFDFNFSFYFLEGNKNKNLGDYENAIKNYTRALTIDNTQPSAYYEIASILFATGDYSSAEPRRPPRSSLRKWPPTPRPRNRRPWPYR